MTTIDTAMRQSAFFTQLEAEIEAGNLDHAVEMIMGLANRREQLAVLINLAIDLPADFSGERVLASTSANALYDAISRTIELVDSHVTDHDIDSSFELIGTCVNDFLSAIYRGYDVAEAGRIAGTINWFLLVRH